MSKNWVGRGEAPGSESQSLRRNRKFPKMFLNVQTHVRDEKKSLQNLGNYVNRNYKVIFFKFENPLKRIENKKKLYALFEGIIINHLLVASEAKRRELLLHVYGIKKQQPKIFKSCRKFFQPHKFFIFHAELSALTAYISISP